MLPARRNPFAMTRIADALPFDPAWCGTDWESLLDRLDAQGGRGWVVGPHGSGKTAFLDALESRLLQNGLSVRRLLLNDEKPRPTARDLTPPARPDSCVWLIDGAERLTWWGWRRVLRSTRGAGGLVASVHRTPRWPRLPILLRTRASPEMLANFVRVLAPGLNLEVSEVEALFHESGGNLRVALWRCYDRCASG